MITKKEITYTLLCPVCHEGCPHCGDGSIESQLVFVETSDFLENLNGRENHAMGCPVCETEFVIDDWFYKKIKRKCKTKILLNKNLVIKTMKKSKEGESE